MTPRQFEAEYGRPVPITAAVPAGGSLVIPADPDRYLIVFWQGAPAVNIFVGEDPDQQGTPLPFPPAALPIVFTQTLHGAMTGMAFTVRTAGPGGTITYVVGQMKPLRRTQPRGGRYRGKAVRNR